MMQAENAAKEKVRQASAMVKAAEDLVLDNAQVLRFASDCVALCKVLSRLVDFV